MKLCDVTQFYAPGSGGVKRYLLEKRRYVQEHTHDEHWLIIPGEKTDWKSEGRLHTVTIRSPIVERRAGYRFLWNTRAVRRVIAQIQPDLIESADPYQLGWATQRVGRELKVPVVGFYHSHLPQLAKQTFRHFGNIVGNRLGRFAERYVRKLYNRFDQTIVASETLAQELKERGIQNVAVCPLGVDTKLFHPRAADPSVRENFKVPAEVFLLLSVGRLSLEKNTRALLQGFEQLMQNPTLQQPVYLLIVGTGPLQPEVVALQQKYPNVRWQMQVMPNQLAELYCSADLFVHPGLQETFGLVMLEAQACGCPVLGINGSRLEELCFTGKEWWATSDAPEELAQAIQKVLTSREVLRATGQAAAQVVQAQFSWKQAFDRLWKVYNTTVSRYKT